MAGDAFEAAFAPHASDRPAAQWGGILDGLARRMTACASLASHYYPGSASRCIWCELVRQGGADFFPGLPLPMGRRVVSVTGVSKRPVSNGLYSGRLAS